MANTKRKATSSYDVPRRRLLRGVRLYGEEVKCWGDTLCSEYAWQANQIVGAADFYPSYGDTALRLRLGFGLSADSALIIGTPTTYG